MITPMMYFHTSLVTSNSDCERNLSLNLNPSTAAPLALKSPTKISVSHQKTGTHSVFEPIIQFCEYNIHCVFHASACSNVRLSLLPLPLDFYKKLTPVPRGCTPPLSLPSWHYLPLEKKIPMPNHYPKDLFYYTRGKLAENVNNYCFFNPDWILKCLCFAFFLLSFTGSPQILI